MSSEEGKCNMEVDSPTTLSDGSAAQPTDVQMENGASVNGSTNGTTEGAVSSSSSLLSSPQKSSDSSTDNSFTNVTHEDTIVETTFTQLLDRMRVSHYNITVDTEELIYRKCKILFEKDYHVETVKNQRFTDNYPKEIIVPIAAKSNIGDEGSMKFDAELYSQLVLEGREARLRSRVVAPAILFDNKFICRSGTVTVWLSAFYERVLKTQCPSETMTESMSGALGAARAVTSAVSNAVFKGAEIAYNTVTSLMEPNMMDRLLAVDIKVMELLNVERICDLMVEYNKHFKEQVNVSSTEKVHKDVYKKMKMEEMPYPGCEFFALYSQANKNPENLVFDWSQSDVTRSLELTGNPKEIFPDVHPQHFKEWDLVQLTQNYLKIMLSYLVTSTGGMVVHCISGWDRTPLFVSLLRLSLWADGVIHKSLDPEEMAYLTVAYDWYLFGHNLPDRLRKNEEVMHFCFNFLQYITTEEFSVTRMFNDLPPEKKENRKFPDHIPGRRMVLTSIRSHFLRFYKDFVTEKLQKD